MMGILFSHNNHLFSHNPTQCPKYSYSFAIPGAFRLYDVDNDGYITRQEMYDIVDAIYQMVVSPKNIVCYNSKNYGKLLSRDFVKIFEMNVLTNYVPM